jgi:DNA-binding NarL/FixJ family response regulator
LQTSIIRILFVEDFEPFRAFIRSTFAGHPHFHLICEASDGLEAIAKARELQPDLILMDIGLPKLNGLEAARRIRTLAPSAKIVFVTQETDIDVTQEAFSLGACDVIAKARAGSDLILRLESVFRSKPVVSSEFATSCEANDCFDVYPVSASVPPSSRVDVVRFRQSQMPQER